MIRFQENKLWQDVNMVESRLLAKSELLLIIEIRNEGFTRFSRHDFPDSLEITSVRKTPEACMRS